MLIYVSDDYSYFTISYHNSRSNEFENNATLAECNFCSHLPGGRRWNYSVISNTPRDIAQKLKYWQPSWNPIWRIPDPNLNTSI